MKSTMTREEARACRVRHDTEVHRLNRLTMPSLRDESRAALAASGIQRLCGGPVTRDELISEIIEMRYPAATMNETSHVLYHEPGQVWSACEWCQP